MATATDRGWAHPPVRRTVRVPCAGIPLNLHPDVAPLFAELIRRVEALKGPGWMVSAGGYNFRPVRGYEERYRQTKSAELLSEHSWALAADFRAGSNPQRANGPSDMPADIVATCRAISPHLVWGGTWSGSRRDPMHFEYVGTPAQARADVARLTHPPEHQEDDDMTEDERKLLRETHAMARHLLKQEGFDFDPKTLEVKQTGFDWLLGRRRDGVPRSLTEAVGDIGKKLGVWS
ncbi:hypothetical protein GCM10027586_00640 [Kineococcus gypseus]|uniref:M15 family metallopeptidase n=1 Tax=Kineococcus gypseus TaxID=1637102 RepID=UPI003D7CBE1C